MKHQSGSDSRLTAEAFFKLRALFFADSGEKEYDGILYGTMDIHK